MLAGVNIRSPDGYMKTNLVTALHYRIKIAVLKNYPQQDSLHVLLVHSSNQVSEIKMRNLVINKINFDM